MMIRKMPKWVAGLTLALVAGAAPLACGGGGGTNDMGGAPSDEGSGGNATDNGSGGNATDGSGGNATDGSGGTDGEAGATGTGGNAPTDASIDELIAAICEWEYGCCDEGEVTYRLGTAAGDSVEDCVDYFTFQLHESNTTSNPFPTGSAQGLLGVLAYTINLSRVTENPAGIGECIQAYEAMDCPSKAEGTAYCAEPDAPDETPCALVNLFNPALEEGDRCTIALAEGGTNDVECEAGTTCLPAGGDNPEDFPICVQRGQDEDPCTEDDDCDYNFYCAPNSDCTAKGDIGDDCTFNDDDPLPDDEDAGCKTGLKCDPQALVCVNACTPDYPCLVNAECPEDYVCAPVTVGSDSTSWKQCVPLGTSASDRCDEDADCAANRYCDGSVCQGDVDINDECDKNAMCESGSFCNNSPIDEYGDAISYYPYYYSPPLICTTFRQAGEPCFFPSNDPAISTGCSPSAPLCLYDTTDARWECAASLRASGADCFDMVAQGLPSECRAGLRCETTDVGEYTCTAGADVGDDCDTAHNDEDELDCGPGLTCKEDVCLAQVGPGEDCEDVENPGDPDDTMCTNSSCVENWDENGPDWICSDAPVPESNGGDDLTCGE